MDVIEKFSGRFCNELLPAAKWYLELAYVISMVSLAVKSADKAWHKKNLFYSYLKAVLFVRGADIILAICNGDSPMQHIADNCTLCTTAVIWWLILFVPFDIFNKILNIEVGDIRPLIIILELMTALRNVVAVDAAITASLKDHPRSYVAILAGTLAGNGGLVVASVFGDFSKQISSPETTRFAFLAACSIGLTKILCPKVVSACVMMAGCSCFILCLKLLEFFDHQVEIFDPIYEIIKKIVVTCDWVKDKYD
ncbi:trimeric intracellular cation channel type A-like [Ciona intestinalis]